MALYSLYFCNFLSRYAEGQFIDAYSPTIENTFQKIVKHRDTEYLIEILDTAGQDEYQIFHMRYAMGIHGYILMYVNKLFFSNAL